MANDWTMRSTRPSSSLVVIDPGQPAHFPFPATPPTYGTETITDVLTVNFSAPSINYTLNSFEGVPTPKGGNFFGLSGVGSTFPITVAYNYNITANGESISDGSGSYTFALNVNNIVLDVSEYPSSVGLDFQTYGLGSNLGLGHQELLFSTPRTSWSIPVTVPEPATYGLIASSGLLAFAIVTRKKVA